MKRLILMLIVVVFVTLAILSCSKQICPAYTFDETTEQPENNS